MNLEKALRSFDLALEVHTRERNPKRWARVMTARCTAYAELPEPSNIQDSIRSFDRALEVYTRRQYPYEWAMAMVGRGLAHQHLETADGAQEAARCYKSALKIFTREKYTINWTQTIINRASLFLNNPDTLADLEDEFEEAVGSLDLTEQVFTRDHYPLELTGIKTLHGVFFFLLAQNDKESGEEAIRSFDAALEVLSAERYPIQCARIINSRGLAYAVIAGSDPVARLHQAFDLMGRQQPFLRYRGFKTRRPTHENCSLRPRKN